jgi:hypothetical protein
MSTNPQITQIARTHLGIATLEARNNDNLDFYDLSVSNIRNALESAYEAGKQSVLPEKQRIPSK